MTMCVDVALALVQARRDEILGRGAHRLWVKLVPENCNHN